MYIRGKNRLRLQKLNVGLYAAGSEGVAEPFVIRDVVISETEEVTEVDISSVPADFRLGAVLVNQHEHAYAKVRFDAQSIDWFTKNLMRVRDPVTRGTIWRYFWMLVMDRKMSSLKYMEFVKLQLPDESVDQIRSVGLMNLRVLISSYIPSEVVSESKQAMFDTLITLMGKEGVPKDSIVDQLFGFLSSEEQVRASVGWL